MSQTFIHVSVLCKFALDQAGLQAVLASLPAGLQVTPFDATQPPQVLVFDVESVENLPLTNLPLSTALLMLIAGDDVPELPFEIGHRVIGLFSKREVPEALSIAVRQLVRGEAYLSPSLALSLIHRKHSQGISSKVDLSNLTEREREVLSLLAEGLSNKAIASRLYLSVRTVDGHLSNLYARLGVSSRMEAMRLAVLNNITPSEPLHKNFTSKGYHIKSSK